MASIPLPALGIKAPEQPDLVSKYLQMKGALQNQQMQQQQMEAQRQQMQMGGVQLQQAQQQQRDQQAITKTMLDWDGKDINTLPHAVVQNGGSGTAAMQVSQHILQVRQQMNGLSESDAKVAQDKNNHIIPVLDSVLRLPPEQQPAALEEGKAALIQGGYLDPQKAQQMQYKGPDQLKLTRNTLMGYTGMLAEHKPVDIRGTGVQLADDGTYKPMPGITPKQPEGEMPLGERVPQLNQALTARYQVLNPGKPLPPYLTLPEKATQKDFDRTDKLLTQTESATGTQAQRETANAMRRQTYAMMQQNQQDRQSKDNLQPVTGTDPNTGKKVLASAGEAKTLGLSGLMKADTDLVNKAHAAETWLQIATKQSDPNAPPEQMGILQLIDKMGDKKLGVVATRWNDFLAGKVGAGDPEFAALRAKMGLSETKLMQAHVGSRGGAFMLEHFHDLANAGKMNAQTLRTGIASEVNYMDDVAMSPPTAQAKPASGAPTGGGPSSSSSMITVQIPGHPPGKIPAASRMQFMKDHPDAQVTP